MEDVTWKKQKWADFRTSPDFRTSQGVDIRANLGDVLISIDCTKKIQIVWKVYTSTSYEEYYDDALILRGKNADHFVAMLKKFIECYESE